VTSSRTPPASAPASPAAWLASRVPLPDDAKPLVADVDDCGAMLDRLLQGGQAPAALRMMAAALPPREGVWWAWVAARHAAQLAGGEVSAAVTEALAAAEQWVANPDDAQRRAAWAAGEKAGLDTAAGCAAAAPFFTAGSVAPPDLAPIPPPAGLHTIVIATAVTLAAATDPAQFDPMAGAYVAQALEIVRQLGGWDRTVEAARQFHVAQADRHRAAQAAPAVAPAS
jgi:Family of unknown function (DUF6931)